MISFGRPNRVLPPNSLGQQFVAQRKVAETAGRAAEKASIAISVDAFPTRVWNRNPRGTVQCPCSSRSVGQGSNPASPDYNGKIILDSGQGDDLEAVDSGYPLDGAALTTNTQLPKGESTYNNSSDWIDNIGRLLLGDGRRCGICWGTGWVDGHHLYGGQRYVCCAVNTPWSTIDDSSDGDIDLDSPTPTFVGPATLVWDLTTTPYINILDAFRIREGLNPADSYGWQLTVFNAANPSGVDVSVFLGGGIAIGQALSANQIPTKLELTLQPDVRVSHIELVLRSEPLQNLQIPNLNLTASTELVQPFIQEEFEVDPKIAWLERGSIFEIPGINGRLGSVWLVQDVNINRTAEGLCWGITGSARNVQPNEVFSCVSLEDALTLGILDYGVGERGEESTEDSEPSGIGDTTDESFAAVNRGSQQRVGGGNSLFAGTITLTPQREGED